MTIATRRRAGAQRRRRACGRAVSRDQSANADPAAPGVCRLPLQGFFHQGRLLTPQSTQLRKIVCFDFGVVKQPPLDRERRSTRKGAPIASLGAAPRDSSAGIHLMNAFVELVAAHPVTSVWALAMLAAWLFVYAASKASDDVSDDSAGEPRFMRVAPRIGARAPRAP